MTANRDKTRKTMILIAAAIGIFSLLAIGMTRGMAADKVGEDAEIAKAKVEFVNPASGVILLGIDSNRQISGINRGDEVEIVVEPETKTMQKQRPRQWRMQRYPYGGPSAQ